MKTLKILTLASPLILILLYFELLNMNAYYKERISVGEILIKESSATSNVKAIELDKIHQEGLGIIRGKYIVELIMLLIVIFLFVSSFFYIKRYISRNNASSRESNRH